MAVWVWKYVISALGAFPGICYHFGMGFAETAKSLFSRFAYSFMPPPRRRKYPCVTAGLVLLVTRRCNLSCKTCLRGEKAQQDIDIGILDKLFDDVGKLGFNMVSLTGGEAILHPGFGEILGKIAARGFLIGLVTNGVRYRDYVKVLAPYRDKIRFIAVSLDSHVRELNDAIRGHGAYDKAFEALRCFSREGYPVRVSHIVNSRNIDLVEDFVQVISREIKPEMINLGSVIRTPGNSPVVPGTTGKEGLVPLLKKLRIRFPALNILSSTGYYSGTLFYCRQFSGFFELSVNTDGDAIFCCDNALDGAVIGNVKEKSLAEICRGFFEMQAEVRGELVNKKLSGEKFPHDCDLCNRILGKYIKGSRGIWGEQAKE